MLKELRRVAEENRYFKVKVLKSSSVGIEAVADKLERDGLATPLSIRGRVCLFKSRVFRAPGAGRHQK